MTKSPAKIIVQMKKMNKRKSVSLEDSDVSGRVLAAQRKLSDLSKLPWTPSGAVVVEESGSALSIKVGSSSSRLEPSRKSSLKGRRGDDDDDHDDDETSGKRRRKDKDGGDDGDDDGGDDGGDSDSGDDGKRRHKKKKSKKRSRGSSSDSIDGEEYDWKTMKGKLKLPALN